MNCCVRVGLSLATFAIAGGFSFRLSAGEPIIFGREKSKVDPVKETKFGKEISKPWESFHDAAPFNGIVPPILPRSAPIDPKRDKRRRAELEEKKNWMRYDRGELQDQAEEEDEQFGVRDYNLDEAEKDDGSIRDLTFKGMDRNRGQFRSPGQGRISSQQQLANQAARQQREREDAEAEAKRDSRSKLDLRGTGEPILGTAGQLNLKGLLGAGDAVRNAEKGDASLSDAFKSGASPEFSREQQARREEFKNFLNGSSGANSLSGLSGPINQRNEFTRQINPVFPKAAEPIGRTVEDPAALRGVAANPYANAYNSPAVQDAYSPRGVSGLGVLPSPFFKSPEPPRPSFGLEPPRMVGRTPGGHRQ